MPFFVKQWVYPICIFAKCVASCCVPALTATWRVLLVDDDPLVCDSIRRLLEFDHHKVTAVANGNDALALAEKETFDLVILDYLMPVMKGDKLAAALKQRFPNLPILMITADAEKVETSSDKPPCVDLLMAKPFQMEELRQALQKIFAKSIPISK